MENIQVRSVNFEKVLTDPQFSALTKSVIRKIQKETYFNFSSFLQTIGDTDLDNVCYSFDRMGKNVAVLEDVIVLSEVLTIAEGCGSQDNETAATNFNYMIVALTAESLKRKGLVDIDYSKVSFDNSAKNINYAKLIGE